MSIDSGGAGSGYIGNSLVSNKKMVGYNVPTSEAESTKTESVNEASESPVSGKPKIGNGYAKIKLVRELIPQSIVMPVDNIIKFIPPYVLSNWRMSDIPDEQLAPYLYRDDVVIETGQQNMGTLTYQNGVYTYPANIGSYTDSVFYYYLGEMKFVHLVKFKYKNKTGNNLPRCEFWIYNSETEQIQGGIYVGDGNISPDFIEVEAVVGKYGDYVQFRFVMDEFDVKDVTVYY